jgi:SAM-dependent methyltransferase
VTDDGGEMRVDGRYACTSDAVEGCKILRGSVSDPARAAAGISIAELGCGTGRFAHDFLTRLKERAPRLYESTTYTLVDLSPALQQSQRRRLVPHGDRCRFVLGNLLHWQPDTPVDVVVNNEVIADLPVRPLYRDDVDRDDGEAAACVRRFGLSLAGLPHATLVNTGAVELLERLPRILAKDGVAVITEYGSRTRGPVRVVLGDHVCRFRVSLAPAGSRFTRRSQAQCPRLPAESIHVAASLFCSKRPRRTANARWLVETTSRSLSKENQRVRRAGTATTTSTTSSVVRTTALCSSPISAPTLPAFPSWASSPDAMPI